MIFYFSATGNTRWAAELLANATGERLVNMADNDVPATWELSENERIGFCFPVHGWRPPMLVRRFISTLDIRNYNGNYVWHCVLLAMTSGKQWSTFLATCLLVG